MQPSRLDPRSISKDALDGAINAEAVAEANLEVAQKQRELTKAGAWTFDIRNQERQTDALEKSFAASSALLAKYTLRGPAGWHGAFHQHNRGKLRLRTGRI